MSAHVPYPVNPSTLPEPEQVETAREAIAHFRRTGEWPALPQRNDASGEVKVKS